MGRLVRRVWVCGLLLVVGWTGPVSRATAAVTLTASRVEPELLYSPDVDADCSALSKLGDDDLPRNVVRLRATAEGASPEEVRFQWSAPKPLVGTLAADLDLGGTDQTVAVRAICADFGSACVLTPETLRFYNLPTILWIAPPCSILPDRSSKAFGGGTVRIGVKARAGKRKLGRARTTIGYGRLGSVTLYTDGRDGLGKRSVEGFATTSFGAVVSSAGLGLPAVRTIGFDNGSGESVVLAADQCPNSRVCTFLSYAASGKFIASVQAELEDGSVLCDKLAVRVGGVNNRAKLALKVMPRRRTYTSGDQVAVRVTVKNVSPKTSRDCIALSGSDALTCVERIRIGRTTDTKVRRFDFQRCSRTADQPCLSDADCLFPRCGDCEDDEICLTTSHCSESLTRSCAQDHDCRAPACTDCRAGEECIRVLATPGVCLPIGDAVDLVDEIVTLENVLPDTAKITDTWIVAPVNADPAQVRFKYGLRGRPVFPR